MDLENGKKLSKAGRSSGGVGDAGTVGPLPSPSSSAHRIPNLILSSRASVNDTEDEMMPKEIEPNFEVVQSQENPSTGEIFVVPNFKGECLESSIATTTARGTQFLQHTSSDGAVGVGGGERAVDLGDKLFIYGGYRDKFLYLYGSQISSEAKRKDFTIFLRNSGILQLISKFILGLHEMQIRPPPKQVVEFLLNSMGSKLVVRDTLKEMKAYRDETKKQIEDLQKESEELLRRLEKYCIITTPYESLNPDDFAHLASKQILTHVPYLNTNVFTTNEPVLTEAEEQDEEKVDDDDKLESITDVYQELVRRTRTENQPQQQEEEEEEQESNEQDKIKMFPDNFDNDGKPPKKLQQSLNEASTMIRRQVLISAQEKYGQMAVVERNDLDVEGLFQHFKALAPSIVTGGASSKMKVTPSKGIQGGDCPNNMTLVIEEIQDDDFKRVREEGKDGGEVKMPPLVITQMRKYTNGTKIFRAPQGQIITSSASSVKDSS